MMMMMITLLLCQKEVAEGRSPLFTNRGHLTYNLMKIIFPSLNYKKKKKIGGHLPI